MLVERPVRLAISVAAAAAIAGILAFSVPRAAASCQVRVTACKWVATWAASPMAAAPASQAAPDDFSPAGFTDQTIRQIVWTSAGGQAARIGLSNRFGTQPVTFGQVDVGISAGGAAVVPGTNRPVTFAGSTSVTVAPGADVVSSAVRMAVPAHTDLAVSLYIRGSTGPATYHSDAQQTNYVSAPGNYADRDSAGAFTMTSHHWYFLDDIDVRAAPQVRGAIVAIGDSITDGYRSTINANDRWPNDLARRLLAGPPGDDLAVVDEGISGNRVLSSSARFGVNAQARFLQDVAARVGVRYVILLEGINDIGFSRPSVSAAQIIAGYENLIAAAHTAGLKIIGATLMPFQGAGYYSAAGEARREAVNTWIRARGAFDGVIDFDKAVRNPAVPLQLLPAYDSGDHLHPNDAGYQAMADAINLALFQP
jgi:lysophospholipase L1-like esterase